MNTETPKNDIITNTPVQVCKQMFKVTIQLRSLDVYEPNRINFSIYVSASNETEALIKAREEFSNSTKICDMIIPQMDYNSRDFEKTIAVELTNNDISFIDFCEQKIKENEEEIIKLIIENNESEKLTCERLDRKFNSNSIINDMSEIVKQQFLLCDIKLCEIRLYDKFYAERRFERRLERDHKLTLLKNLKDNECFNMLLEYLVGDWMKEFARLKIRDWFQFCKLTCALINENEIICEYL